MKLRNTSLDHICLHQWYWQKFIDDAITSVSKFNLSPFPLSSEFIDKKVLSGPRNKPFHVSVQTWAGSTDKLKLARAACIKAGDHTDVLNFVLIPSPQYDLPFFGADFVSLPSGHLIALDLQPVLRNDLTHFRLAWEGLAPIFNQWSKEFPLGGRIPDEAKKYFSPGFLWTKLPLDVSSDQLIQSKLLPAFNAYLSLYIDLLEKSELVSSKRSELLYSGQKEYLEYRAAKDPARAMLTRFFGSSWTEEYIHEVLFKL